MSKPIRRILVIDDDPDALQILSDYLKIEGYEVEAATDGASGMQLLAASPVELVITDLNLPGISGMDVIDIIRKNYPHIQVIVVTGYGSMETVLEALHKGAIDYLTKPFLFEILKLSLQKAEQQLLMNKQLAQLKASGAHDHSASMLQKLPLACALVDEEGNLLSPNTAFLELFQQDRNSFTDLYDPLSANQAQKLDRLLSSDSSLVSLLLEYPLAGGPRAIEMSLLNLEDVSALRLLCVEPILSEEQQIGSDELEATLIVSQHGTILWGNESAVDFLGLDVASTEDQHVLDLIRGAAGKLLHNVFDGLPALTQTWKWRTAIPSVNGRNRQVHLCISPLIDDQHRRSAVCLTFSSCAPPEGSGAYFREKAVGDSVALLSIDGAGKIRDMSTALVKMLGQGTENWIGRDAKKLLTLSQGKSNRERGSLLAAQGPMPVICQGKKIEGVDLLVYQLRQDTEHMPLEESIEQQRRRLEQASNLLMELSLGSDAGSDEGADLRKRLENLVASVTALPGLDRALLLLGNPSRDAHSLSCSGYNREAQDALKDPALLLKELEALLDTSVREDHTNMGILDSDHILGPGFALPVPGYEGRRHGVLVASGDTSLSGKLRCLLQHALESLGAKYEEFELNLQLRRTEEKFRQLYDKARFAVFMIDLDDASILDVNQAACDLTGFSSDELLGKRIWELRPTDFRKIARRNWIKSISSNGETRFEGIPLVRRDGKLIYVEYDSLLTEHQGHRVLQSFYRDITEKQAMEFTLNQSQKLAGLGQLSAGIAHELRNPLGIMGSSLYYINSTLDRSEQESSPQLRKHLGIIGNEVERARKIIENLLSFSRVSKVERERVNLVELLSVTLDLVKKELLVNNIQLEKDLQLIPPIELNLDEMKQALLNIIINATQAMPDGGTLTIRTRIEQDRIVLSFRDTGIGISKEDLPNVLNPFFTTKDPGKGTGLGLSLTHTIIQRSGGNLKIESEVGSGTEVSIELPVRKEHHGT